ncbi:MAG: DUF1109 domain-containing protein [Devosia sp.]|uniref:DUF1109 domain-containing protein n=1 Tax=Devosia sp. TaxID=1871048 RepID=UPI0024C9D357|nr:DUF1109 domain-containing protein [Devosia sp.]UYO01099.1 MAG: DUF1109 domain-containing protein [Devosia sp.]
MTDDLITRLSSDLAPVSPRAMERHIALALAIGALITLPYAWLVLDLWIGRPFVPLWGDGMFAMKFGYTLAFALFGFAAVPALSRPDGRIRWPLVAAGLVVLLALGLGTMNWMGGDWAMPMLMGQTAMVCPWLITLTGLPVLTVLLIAMRRLAPRSPSMAGLAAGLLAGGFGAWVYAFFCGENSMMFIAVWYSLGIALTALAGAALGRILLRW